MTDNPYEELHKKDVAAGIASKAPAPAIASTQSANPYATLHAQDTAPKAAPAAPGGGGFMDRMKLISQMPMTALKTLAPGIHAAVTGARHGASLGMSDKYDAAVQGRPETAIAAENQQVMKQHPGAYAAGHFAGSGLAAGAVSGGLGGAIPALGRLTLPSVVANQALTGAGMAAGEDIARGNTPDPFKVGVSGAASGLLGGAIHVGGGMLMPSFRTRAAGAGLNEADKAAAYGLAKKSEAMGVPLKVPEAVKAVAPGKAGDVEAAYNSARSSPGGSVVARNFEAAREPGIGLAASRLATEVSGDKHLAGHESKQAASTAIKGAVDFVKKTTEPLLKQADPVLVKGVPKSKTIEAAQTSIAKKPHYQDKLGKAPPHSVKVLRTVLDHLQSKRSSAYNAGRKGEVEALTPHIDTLQQKLEDSSIAYKIAHDTHVRGMEEHAAPVINGPLGKISQDTSLDQHAAHLLDATTPEAERASIDAVKRLPPDVSKGILAHRISKLASTEPQGIGDKLMPTVHSERVVNQILQGSEHGSKIADLIQTLKAIKGGGTEPYAHTADTHGPIPEAWLKLKQMGMQRQAQMLHNPETIKTLGIMSPTQRGLTLGGTTLGTTVGKKLKLDKPTKLRAMFD